MVFSDNKDKTISKLPFGFRDIFPTEASERKVLKDAIRKEFELWGYGEIKTPAIEYTTNIAKSAGEDWKEKLLSFFDRDSNLVSLRADMTIPIARFTGMRLKSKDMPARFYYFANCFRQAEAQKGLKRVINQAGIELIGSSSFVSDIEVLSILINMLEKSGIDDFKIGLGHIGILEGLYDWLGIRKDKRVRINRCLESGDLVSVRSLLGKGKKTDIFFEVLKPKTDIKKLKKLSSDIGGSKLVESVKYLEKIFAIMEKLGKDKDFIIDIGKKREFGYYSGLFFEIFSKKTNMVLGSGGRYDGLIKRFGLDVPATGFALDIDLLHSSTNAKNYSKLFVNPSKSLVAGDLKDCEKVFMVAAKLQQAGNVTKTYFAENINEEGLVKKESCDYIYIIDKNAKNIRITDIKEAKQQIYSLKDYLNW